MSTAYLKLEARARRITDIEGALALLRWDSQTFMPRGSSTARGEQIATLSLMVHELMVAAEHADLLAEAEAEGLDPWQLANLGEMRQRQRRALALDSRLVSALARTTSQAELTWREARMKADWSMMQPAMEEVLDLCREKAVQLGAALGLAPYDALLDLHEQGLTRAVIDPLFDQLAVVLPPMLDDALARQLHPEPLNGPFSIEQQKVLAKTLMAQLGFDFDRGRLDESAHPFCGGTPDDVRITTRYDTAQFASCLMAVLHETGHALYNAGLPQPWRGQPVGEALGMVVHESQSLLIEMQVCRSRPFLAYLAPQLVQAFDLAGREALTPDNLYRHAIRVERGFIRVDADELTYPLHIILRYRLEQALLSGDLPLVDLPAAWNAAMAELLGIIPANDAQGCLQDIHWPVGAFGYFPCYTLGAIMAAQLFQQACREDAGLLTKIERGEFTPLITWLRQQVHEQGCRYDFSALLERATGKGLALQPYLDHLEARYLS